jgi:hypothetical protein
MGIMLVRTWKYMSFLQCWPKFKQKATFVFFA